MPETIYKLTNASSAAQTVGSGRSRATLFKNGDASRIPESEMTEADYTKVNDGTLTSVPPVGASAAAVVITTNADTYNIAGASSDGVQFKIDGVSVAAFTLTAGGARTAVEVVADLNANGPLFALATASVVVQSGNDAVRLESDRTAGNSIEIEAVANDAYTVLGLSVGVTAPATQVQDLGAISSGELARFGTLMHKLVNPASATDHPLPFQGSELMTVLYHADLGGAVSADDLATVTVTRDPTTKLTVVNFATDHTANIVYVLMRP